MNAIVHDVGGVDQDLSLNQASATEPEKVALAKIKALFPDISSSTDVLPRVEELFKSNHDLIAGTHILETDSRADVVEYMGSLVPFTVSEEPKLWPLVKVVKLYVDSEHLKTGAILVDLPGFRDSNAARTAVTRQYMTRANEIVVVARLTRAATDQTTGELSREGYMKRLKHDGRKHLTIVCTCSDQFEPSDAAEDFKGDKQFLEKYHSLNNEIESRHADLDSLSKAPKKLDLMRQEILSLETQLQQLCSDARDKYATESIINTYRKLLGEDTSITCFVTSSHHYLKHLNPRKALGIMSMEQTQIPMLQNYCASAPLEQKLALARQFDENLGDIRGSARVFAGNASAGVNEVARRRAKHEMDQAFRRLSAELNNEALVLATNMQNNVGIFLDSLSGAIARGEKNCLDLHGKLIKANRFPAVKSAYLHHGESTTGKLKNINEQFLSPLGGEVEILWGAFITETEKYLKDWNDRVLHALTQFEISWQDCIDKNFESSPKGRSTSVQVLEEFLMPRLERAQALATDFCQKLVEDQRPARRLFLFPDRLKELLGPGYDRATEEKGTGAFERMVNVFEKYVREAHVFGSLGQDIEKEVVGIQERSRKLCEEWGRTLAEGIQGNIHGWLKNTEDIGKEEAGHRAEILRIVEKYKTQLDTIGQSIYI
ncbi:hypothetical protein TWF730_004339 [Orbilia blumenaviensis]